MTHNDQRYNDQGCNDQGCNDQRTSDQRCRGRGRTRRASCDEGDQPLSLHGETSAQSLGSVKSSSRIAPVDSQGNVHAPKIDIPASVACPVMAAFTRGVVPSSTDSSSGQPSQGIKRPSGNILGRPPVWLMRQVGRYMPQYQELRRRYRLKELFTRSELIAEATHLGPDLLGVDAAIIFSDILLPLDPIGCALEFGETGPYVQRRITEIPVKEWLPPKDAVDSMSYTLKAIQQLKQELSCPLLGFAGAPFTIAAFGMRTLEQGRSSERDWLECVYRGGENIHEILSLLTEYVIEYLLAQWRAGVDCVQLFESCSTLIDARTFEVYCRPYLMRIFKRMKQESIPIIFFAKSMEYFLPSLLADSEFSQLDVAISVDWHSCLRRCRKLTSGTLQGNLNPWMLLNRERALRQIDEIVDVMRDDRRFIFNLGHGVLPMTDMSVVAEAVAYFQEISKWSS